MLMNFLNDGPPPPGGCLLLLFSLQRLVLRRNKIKSVDNALRFYQELVYVDFSHNRSVLDDFSPPSTFMFRWLLEVINSLADPIWSH